MKLIVAMIQPFKLSAVTRALEKIPNFPGMTVTDARGFGREKSQHEEGAQHRVVEDFVEYVKKARVEVAARDEMADEIVEAIAKAAHTGNRGDGKIFVLPLVGALRVQTGHTDDEAL